MAAYHRVIVCLRYYGNAKHNETMKEVSLAEFQACVRARHAVGSNGMEKDDGIPNDYK